MTYDLWLVLATCDLGILHILPMRIKPRHFAHFKRFAVSIYVTFSVQTSSSYFFFSFIILNYFRFVKWTPRPFRYRSLSFAPPKIQFWLIGNCKDCICLQLLVQMSRQPKRCRSGILDLNDLVFCCILVNVENNETNSMVQVRDSDLPIRASISMVTIWMAITFWQTSSSYFVFSFIDLNYFC